MTFFIGIMTVFTIVILLIQGMFNPWISPLSRDEQKFSWALQFMYVAVMLFLLILTIKK